MLVQFWNSSAASKRREPWPSSNIQKSHFFFYCLTLEDYIGSDSKRKMLLKCIYDFHFYKNIIIISFIQALIQHLIIYSTRYCVRYKGYRNHQNSQPTNKYIITNLSMSIQGREKVLSQLVPSYNLKLSIGSKVIHFPFLFSLTHLFCVSVSRPL